MGRAPGRNFLLVTGILLVVFASLALLLFLFALLAMLIPAVASTVTEASGVSATILMVYFVISIILACFNLVAGIIGIKNNSVLEKAQLCFSIGIAMIVLQAFSLILAIVSGEFSAMSLIGFVLPVLYLIGANINKKALAQHQQFSDQQYPNQHPNQY